MVVRTKVVVVKKNQKEQRAAHLNQRPQDREDEQPKPCPTDYLSCPVKTLTDKELDSVKKAVDEMYVVVIRGNSHPSLVAIRDILLGDIMPQHKKIWDERNQVKGLLYFISGAVTVAIALLVTNLLKHWMWV